MQTVNCPNCNYVNSTTENFCLNCGATLQTSRRVPSFVGAPPAQNTSYGRTVFILYSIVMVLTAFGSLGWMILGFLAMVGSTTSPDKNAPDAFKGGVMFFVYGLVFFVPLILAPFFNRKTWHWSYGLVMLVLSPLASCGVALPFTVALLIFWVKPETKMFFERN